MITAKAHPQTWKRFRTRLKEAREDAGLSYAQAAVAIDGSVSSIVFYESGRTIPSLPVLVELARAYGVTISELIDDVDVAA